VNSAVRHSHHRRRGFLMMEVVLALGIFGIAVTGFTIAIARTAEVAAMAQRQSQINRLLESSLSEALATPNLEVGRTTVVVEETIAGASVEIDTLVEELTELEAENGQLLDAMYRIEVSAHWFADGEWREEMAETWRYGRLYQQ
jgi:Tfp pilus assembly protein PilV